ncbi:alpha/beta fold hydrolase [Roseibium aggregatum]|uniref:alpha/beta fold hydrolase n=1 Tax=Roseibium aggregatum TaxID=187304 RepID=UPI0025ACA6AC|nr:alpha/beta hydrolase [Roseibium aggregatum]WJS03217.1 alpha/beta hydrolase [Roseibium aggregatum]
MNRRDAMALVVSAVVFARSSLARESGDLMFVDSGDVRIATQTFGVPEGTPLLLIMGATASMLGWPDELCNLLAEKGFFVIRFDHRDTGCSTTVPPGEATYAIEDMATDVLAVMESYGLPAAHLAGMSLGGYISQMLALSHPERIHSVTLIGSEPLGWDGAPLPTISDDFLRHFAGFGELDWQDRRTVSRFLVEIDRLCSGTANTFDAEAALARVEKVLDRTESPASMFNHSSRTTRENWAGRFREISCPVFVLHGSEDPILPVENGRALAEGIPGAELAILEGVGHELPGSHHREIADRMIRFALAR